MGDIHPVFALEKGLLSGDQAFLLEIDPRKFIADLPDCKLNSLSVPVSCIRRSH
jgi:hypothetical protein